MKPRPEALRNEDVGTMLDSTSRPLRHYQVERTDEFQDGRGNPSQESYLVMVPFDIASTQGGHVMASGSTGYARWNEAEVALDSLSMCAT